MSLKRCFRRGWWDGERARELEAHLAIETDENIARGMSAADARLAALRKLGTPRPAYEIVGLTRDSKYGNLRTPFEPLLYVPVAEDDLSATTVRLVVRSRLPLTSITAAVTAQVRELHPAVVITFRTMQSQVEDSLLRERLMASLFGFFGGLAALLAMIGVYGVMSYSVTRRRNEIGVRMALGADRGDVVRMVMREAGLLLAAGVAIGTLMALVVGSSARSLFFGLKAHDPATLAAAVLVLCGVAAAASYIPRCARRGCSPPKHSERISRARLPVTPGCSGPGRVEYDLVYLRLRILGDQCSVLDRRLGCAARFKAAPSRTSTWSALKLMKESFLVSRTRKTFGRIAKSHQRASFAPPWLM